MSYELQAKQAVAQSRLASTYRRYRCESILGHIWLAFEKSNCRTEFIDLLESKSSASFVPTEDPRGNKPENRFDFVLGRMAEYACQYSRQDSYREDISKSAFFKLALKTLHFVLNVIEPISHNTEVRESMLENSRYLPFARMTYEQDKYHRALRGTNAKMSYLWRQGVELAERRKGENIGIFRQWFHETFGMSIESNRSVG